jgi:adenylate kinase
VKKKTRQKFRGGDYASVLDEARDLYEEDIVKELPSNTVEEMNLNVDRCRVWMEHWITNN